MVQFNIVPQDTRNEDFGSSIGQGIGKYFGKQEENKQASMLSRLLDMNQNGEIDQQEFFQLRPEYRLAAEKLLNERERSFNRPPPGGVSAQPVPPEIGMKIEEIIRNNPNASSDQLQLEFDKNEIPRNVSASYVQNRRESDVSREKAKIEEGKLKRKEQIEFHKETAKYDEKLNEKADLAKRKLDALSRQRKLIDKIGTWDRVVGTFFKGSPYEDIFKSKNAQEFDSYALPLIEGQKDNFGVRLSDADLRLVLQKIATSTKNPEVNKAIVEWNALEYKLDAEKRKIADEIRKENNGLRPLDYLSQIRKRMDEKFGDEIQAKFDEIIGFEDDPKQYEEITGRNKVKAGTMLNDEAFQRYYQLSEGNSNLAAQMAKEDGYEF